MFDNTPPIVGLSIGTSIVVAAVGQLNEAGTLNFIGLGQSPSRGVRKGEICDVAKAEEDVRVAIAEAEQMADVEISSVYLGVTGSHIHGMNNRGLHQVVSPDRIIAEDDYLDVIKNAKAVNLPAEGFLIHDVRQHFVVDGHDGITDPRGMSGGILQVDMHVVYGNFNRLQNSVRLVKGLQLEVETIVFNGLASSLAVLSHEQKSLGALVIDIGGGTCEYTVYCNGIVKHTGVLAIGGDHISNDLAYALKVPLGQADDLKRDHGSAMLDDDIKGQTINIVSDNGLPPKVINLEHLRKVMHVRLDEMLRLIHREVDKQGLWDYIRAGVVLCGGGANIRGIRELAETIFKRSTVTISNSSNIGGVQTALDQPDFATAVGLVKYGSFHQKRKGPGGLKGKLNKVINAFKKI